MSELEMPDGGLAEGMMDHFLSGSSAPVRVNLQSELERNSQLREFLTSRIETEVAKALKGGMPLAQASGAIWVPQAAYGSSDAGKDQSLALGGTYFEYQVAGSAANGGLEIRVNVADHYFWSPSEHVRATHCLHECGAALVASGDAAEFYQVGEGTLIIGDSSRIAPMAEPAAEANIDG